MFHFTKSLFRCVVVCVAALAFGGVVWGQEKTNNSLRLVAQAGHFGELSGIAFSPNGRLAITGGYNAVSVLWDVATGKELRRLQGYSPDSFSHDSRYVLVGNSAVWDTKTGNLEYYNRKGGDNGKGICGFDKRGQIYLGSDKNLSVFRHGQEKMVALMSWEPLAGSMAISHDDQFAVTGHADGCIRFWNLETWQLEKVIKLSEASIRSIDFDADNSHLLTLDSKNRVIYFNLKSNKTESFLAESKAKRVYFSNESNIACIDSVWGEFLTVALPSFQTIKKFPKPYSYGAAIVPSQPFVAFGVGPDEVGIFNYKTGALVKRFGGGILWSQNGRTLKVFPNSKRVLVPINKYSLGIYDLDTMTTARKFVGHKQSISASDISVDGKTVITGEYYDNSIDSTVRVWDVATGRQRLFLKGHKYSIITCQFYGGDNRILSSDLNIIKMWDVSSGRELNSVKIVDERFSHIENVVLLPGTNFVAVSIGVMHTGARQLEKERTEIWDLEKHSKIVTLPYLQGSTMKVIRRTDTIFDILLDESLSKYSRQTHWIFDLASKSIVKKEEVAFDRSDALPAKQFLSENIYIQGSETSIAIKSAVDRNILCNIYRFADGTWAVTDPEGRYDASNGGDVQGLHWVKGLTPIDLKQFKDGFYEPGLLAKKLGYNKEPLRNVPLLADLKLFPETSIAPITDTKTATLNLTNQDGGLGAVQVFVNDKELTADARPQNFDAAAKNATLTVNLDTPLVKPGQQNTLRVVTRNSAGTLASRPVEATWNAPGVAEKRDPQLYAIVCGVSNYANTKQIRDLKFAAKDARDMARALQLGGTKLFGTQGLHLQLFTGENKPKNDVPRRDATKANFKQAFEIVAEQAKPGDVLVVYLAGHGTTLGLGSSTYCYLTQDAAGTDFSDEKNRAAWSVTSEELTEWTKKIPAQKQVLMLDTCAAGAAENDLTKHRDISGDAIRAMERLKDRTGFHVLMGAASDAVSYEAGRYNQGLLTYALLEGMKGRALREDKFVDVNGLFGYVRERVPQLAKNIGGIQQPQISAPRGETFDVALVTDTEKKAIPLSIEQPQVLRPTIYDLDDEGNFDTLKMEPLLREALSAVGAESERSEVGMVYIDRGELPGALRPLCAYKIKGQSVTVRIELQRDGKTEGTALQVTDTKDDLASLARQIAQVIRVSVAAQAGIQIGEKKTSTEKPTAPAAKTTKRDLETPNGPTESAPPQPQAGEIALRGVVKSVDVPNGRFVLEARSFRLPSGRESGIAPKNKTIVVTAQTAWRGAALNTLKIGALVEAIGTDKGTQLTARDVFAK